MGKFGKLRRRGPNSLKNYQQKGEGREKIQNLLRRGDVFILVSSLLVIMVSNTAFRKPSLENLFVKVVDPGTFKHWSSHTGLLVLLVFFLKLQVICWQVPELPNSIQPYFNRVCPY